jgi:hypothetical protein
MATLVTTQSAAQSTSALASVKTENNTFENIFEKKEALTTFSTTLPNGQKMTINTGEEGMEAVVESIKDLGSEEKSEAIAKFQAELIENTEKEDAEQFANDVSEMASTYKEPKDKYSVPAKFEYTVDEDGEKIEAKSRQTYVWYFKAHQRRTAIASLQMCRVVYEASKSLDESDFDEFCKNIGYKSESSTIRKFTVVGKVYPRLIKYADQLPAAWTSIYALTQMPADEFERCIESGYRLCDLSGGEIDQLVKQTRQINNLMSPFKLDKKQNAICVAKVYFTRKMDDVDLRLLQKAFDEVAARLPVKLSIETQVLEMFKERANQRYQKLKQEAPETAIKPEAWDYGVAANSVYNKDAA